MTSESSSVPTFEIGSSFLRAEISQRGAELVRLQDEAGRDLLWNGDPAFWSGRAPLLFPIVGRLKDDRLLHDGQSFAMKQHGIARISTFEPVTHEPNFCQLRLRSNDETRRSYPFDFSFDVTFRVDAHTLDIGVLVRNLGSEAMPVSMGFHPAFRWPLPYGAERQAHEITFEREEPEPIREVAGGLMTARQKPTPVQGRHLRLADDLFKEDALIWTNPASRKLRYGASGQRGIEVGFPLMPDLGIWSKPGAGFVCVEPWYGYASPEDFIDDITWKPGSVSLPPDGEHRFGMSVALDPA